MSATRNESALRTDFELAQQLCSDQSGVGQQADHPEQDEETVVSKVNKCRLEQLSLSPMSVELARKWLVGRTSLRIILSDVGERRNGPNAVG